MVGIFAHCLSLRKLLRAPFGTVTLQAAATTPLNVLLLMSGGRGAFTISSYQSQNKTIRWNDE